MSRNRFNEAEWDRRHFERSMDMVRDNQRDPDESSRFEVGAGGVFSAATRGSGAEYYDITGENPNPLLEKKHHRVKGPKGDRRSDDRIHDEIFDRLTQHPLIDASMMEVTVVKGEVTLTGEVLDRRMKNIAEDVADSVSGVKDIHNRLRISREDAA